MKLTKSKWNRLFVRPELGIYGPYIAIRWNRDWDEWVVWSSLDADSDYHTADADDALATAYHMVQLKQDQEHRETAPADCLCNVCIPH
jgi:uncharacterized protein YhjY with autotransporter beta-barrel domain